MNVTDWLPLIETLKKHGVEFDQPLTESETAEAEMRFQFIFPADLRRFLQTALPRGAHFPDWRALDEKQLTNWLNRPREGVLFDVAHNNFWLEEWGIRPVNLAEASTIVNKLIDNAPKLIPIYMHRMIPSVPSEEGNPVFSVHQTDIIVYGSDLTNYLAREFDFTQEEFNRLTLPTNTRKIHFWDIDRFQDTRWGEHGECVFDNRRNILPES